MLEELPPLNRTEIIHRFGNRREPLDVARRMGLDEQAVDELLAFLGPESRTMDAKQLLDDPFRQKQHWAPRPTRFSDGTWPVFYAALERETSEQEIGHHYVSAAMGDPSRGRTVYYSVFHCQFSGEARDLRKKQEEWGGLVSPDTDNPFCQNLGREAVEAGIDGFLAPSARVAGGTTVPAFAPDCLSRPQIDGDAAFSFDTTAGAYVVTYA